MRRAPGSCGSASAKALRTTIVGRGRVSAARLHDGLINRQEDVIPLTMPSLEELQESLRVQVCWWCGSSQTIEGKEIRSWGMHFAQAHHLDLQALRDILCVPKKHRFPLHPDTRAAFSENGKRQYDPQRLTNHGGPHVMSAYGLRVQVKKLETARLAQRELGEERGRQGLPAYNFTDKRRAKLCEVSRESGLARRRTRICVVCGEQFWRPKVAANGIVCCGEVCARVRDSENGKKGALARVKNKGRKTNA